MSDLLNYLVAASFWNIGIAAIFIVFCVILVRLDIAKNTNFSFDDLFTYGDWNGKASVSRLGYFGAFLVHSLVVLHKEMVSKDGGVDYGTISSYALIWSGAYVILKTIDMKAHAQGAPNEPGNERKAEGGMAAGEGSGVQQR